MPQTASTRTRATSGSAAVPVGTAESTRTSDIRNATRDTIEDQL